MKDLTLKRGFRLLLRHDPAATSVSMGVYAMVSLSQEPVELNGIAHFLEHMSFKGTPGKSAKKIAEILDSMGGRMNAHTSKEYTAYYITVLPGHFNKGFDLLTDLFINSTLTEEDIQTEKQVVLEEINMYEDTPDENIHDIFANLIWDKHKLGLPIIGTKESLDRINQPNLRDFKNHYFNPKNLIISMAGNLPAEGKLIEKIEKAFDLPKVNVTSFDDLIEIPKPSSAVKFQLKKTEQIHFCIGGQGIAHDHPDHFKLSVLNTILGGAMSSRLFQKIREKKGYAYAVYSYPSFYKNSGLFTIYGGINKKKFPQTLKIISQEINSLKTKPVSPHELQKAKDNLKGNLALSLERSSSWMSWIARSKMYYGRVYPLDEMLTKIDEVTAQDVQAMATEFFNPDCMALAAIGPFGAAQFKYNGLTLTDYLAKLNLSF